jgi:GntR family transcriptional regulator, uxu operon transcriptional repressor
VAEAQRSVPDTPAGSPAEDAHTQRGLRLAERIVAESLRAGLGPGGRLPTERRLALDLGMTRSSVRHALAILEAQGRISREVGRGTFLRSRLPPPVVSGSMAQNDGAWQFQGHREAGAVWPGQGGATVPGTAEPWLPERGGSAVAAFAPADVMAVRRLLEPPAMSLAVAWATSADLEEMDRCLAGGDRAASYEDFEAWDLALHRCIIAATHSPLLATLYEAIETARHGQVWGDLKRRSASPERRREYQIDHHELVAALRARDPARAIEAMRLHLARVSGHLNATDPAAGITWR